MLEQGKSRRDPPPEQEGLVVTCDELITAPISLWLVGRT